MSEELPEITPQKISDDVNVVLLLTASDRDGLIFSAAYADNHQMTGEQQARAFLSNYGNGSHNRCAGMVRVRVPRALLKERWTEDQA